MSYMSDTFTDKQNPDNTITLSGHGQVASVPDLAVIRLGVLTSGLNLTDIQSENAEIIGIILRELRQLGINDIKTFQYSIDKIYDFEDGTPIDRGFSVRNILEIKTDNIDQVGTIIDTSVNAGANVVDLISFDVAGREYYYQQALNMAIDNAIQKAGSISANLGILVDPVPKRIIENTAVPIQPLMQREFAATPIVPGDILIEALVTVEFSF